MSFGQAQQQQFWLATKRPDVRTLAFLRVPTTVNGFVNPPTMAQPQLAAAVSAAASTISIVCTSAFGRLAAGDRMQIGQEILTVAADAESLPLDGASAGFASVSIVGVTQYAHALGTPVSVTFAADVPVYAKINSYPRRLVDGSLIQVQDLMVTIGAFDAAGRLLADPFPFTLIGVNGDLRSIVSVVPNRVGPTIVSYTIQAR